MRRSLVLAAALLALAGAVHPQVRGHAGRAEGIYAESLFQVGVKAKHGGSAADTGPWNGKELAFVFCLDDCHMTQYDDLVPRADSLAVPMTFMVVENLLQLGDAGNAMYFDTSELTEMLGRPAGHDINFHSHWHAATLGSNQNYGLGGFSFGDSLSTTAVSSELDLSEMAVRMGGDYSEAYFRERPFGYPNHNYSAAVIDSVRAKGFIGARTAPVSATNVPMFCPAHYDQTFDTGPELLQWGHQSNIYKVACWANLSSIIGTVASPKTKAQVFAAVDQVVADALALETNPVIVFYGHSSASGFDIDSENFSWAMHAFKDQYSSQIAFMGLTEVLQDFRSAHYPVDSDREIWGPVGRSATYAFSNSSLEPGISALNVKMQIAPWNESAITHVTTGSVTNWQLDSAAPTTVRTKETLQFRTHADAVDWGLDFWDISAAYNARDGLVYFDLASTLSGKVITSAVLHLKTFNDWHGGNYADAVLKVIPISDTSLDDYIAADSGVCWNYFTGTSTWVTPLRNYGDESAIGDGWTDWTLRTELASTGTMRTFDVPLDSDTIAAMNDWLSGDSTEGGFYLSVDGTGFATYYGSIFGTHYSNAAHRMWLEVNIQ